MNLELIHEKEQASLLFEKLLNLMSMHQSGIKLEDDKIMKVRALLVKELAREFLGKSWTCPVKT